MKSLKILDAEQVVEINRYICEQGGNPHICYGIGKIESALHTAFYPGTFPYEAGGVAKLAGALCFHLVKSHAFADGNKRTGAIASITLMNINGWDLKYPLTPNKDINELARVIDQCAASEISKDQLMAWFELHKVVSK